MEYHVPALGDFGDGIGLVSMEHTSDGIFSAGKGGADAIYATGDGKVEIVCMHECSVACVKSALGYPSYYPIKPLGGEERPVAAVLMDLDGTTVRSEPFWISIIEMSVRSLLGKLGFELDEADMPFVAGHSVSEHLAYCIRKYCPDRTLDEAIKHYFEHTEREMDLILHHGKSGAFLPAPGVKEFLLALKGAGVKIGLVTSGLYRKAYPEILAAFRHMGLGDPLDFYDSIVTAGTRPQPGAYGTLGELESKPHPWLYAESGCVGLGIPAEDSATVIGIEDSGAGVCSVRLAGYSTVGIGGGNIKQSGTMAFVTHYCEGFDAVGELIRGRG
ncbi:MAG: HAD family phosphatase [Clostridiales Family XIII bacterium]|jgi:beta-phosphoglucomutase-like phosphatase (HAD superfamily)|nr:HAD family phosphatase [Clostridiales Family XIII bacterium]